MRSRPRDDDWDQVWAEYDHIAAPPLTEYYRTRDMLVSVDGMGTVDEVASRIEQALV